MPLYWFARRFRYLGDDDSGDYTDDPPIIDSLGVGFERILGVRGAILFRINRELTAREISASGALAFTTAGRDPIKTVEVEVPSDISVTRIDPATKEA